MKSLLIFIAGMLLGANLMFFFYPGKGDPKPRPAAGQVDIRTTPSTLPAVTAADAPTTPIIASTQASPTQAARALLAIPVAGIRPEQLSDTFNDRRGSERIHAAMDIMAATGTPVTAVADGRIAKLFESKQGGLTVYQFDATETYAYYYAHLDAYAPQLKEGTQLKRGDAIGTVGYSGNANPAAPHLHFAVFQLSPEKKWWNGTPVNPYPLMRPKG